VGVRLFLNDKVVHFLQYAAGGFLAAGALVGGAGRRTWLAGVLFAFLWGASDEYHQSFVPGRDATVLDLMADVAGGAAGALVLTYAVRRRGTPYAEPSPGVAATKEQNPT
jgi:VanZ family protein